MITVWGRASSSNVQPVMWCAAELGLETQRVDVGGRFGGLETGDFAALNPNRKIPVLRDGDLTLWESRAILRYLAGAYGSEGFWPTTPRARAPIDQWLEWAKTTVDAPLITGVFWGYWRTPEAERDMAAVMAAWGRVTDALQLAERQLGQGAFLCGETFTLADIGLGALLYRFFTLPLERPALPNLAGYYDRLSSRPGYRRHVMVDYAELYGRLEA